MVELCDRCGVGRAVAEKKGELLCARHYVETCYESSFYECLERLESGEIESIGLTDNEDSTELILKEVRFQYPGIEEAFEKVFDEHL